MRTFILPDLGEGLQEAHIVEWHVGEGDAVSADQPLVSVETDKAVTEIPVPWSGRVARLLSSPGQTVKVGSPLAEFETASGSGEALHVTASPAAEASRAATIALVTGSQRPLAMPAVRSLARELGVDLADVRGTGPGGAVVVRDVAAAFRVLVGSATSESPAVAHEPAAGFEPLDAVRATMARRMAQSRAAVTPATVFEEARITAWHSRDDITSRLVRAIAAAAKAEPALNAWFDGEKGLKRHATLDLGIAVDAPAGLVVPVLRDAGSLGAAAVRAGVDRLVRGALDRTLSTAELRDPTFTLSNYGMIAGLHATPVVLPPQVAILGAGRVRRVLVPAETGPAAAVILPLSFTYDHRPVSGGEAARFVRALVADLERED
jgi:pyruvate dehydrogenase E2 component (dihydrolipoamide acetyltransferase)